MKELKIKKLQEDAILPEYAYPLDAGMDLFSSKECVIKAKSWELVPTGIAISLPHNCEAQVRSKSGLALHKGIFVLNSPGTIEENYRGEVKVILMNLSNEDYVVEKGQKIAQMVINEFVRVNVKEVSSLSQTDRGEGGFGSTTLKKA